MRTQLPPQLNLVALAGRIQPQDGALAAARSHAISVRTRLSRTFALHSAKKIGSHARQTAIHRFSDLDFMVVLRREEFTWADRLVSSDTILNRLVADLSDRYPATDVRRDVLAASLVFGSSGQSLDVVPAMFLGFNSSRPVYQIPDGQGGWLRTSPETHDRHFAIHQERSGNRLRKVSQLLKWWKHARSQPLPIRSFYIDMVLCRDGLGAPVGRTYGECMEGFFEYLVATECSPLMDPCGVAGKIAPNDTYAQRGSLNRAASFALQHARAASLAERRRDFAEANRQWGIVFNGAY